MIFKMNSRRRLLNLYLTILMAILTPSLFAADSLVWQLGKKNGSEFDFSPYYNAWEYGNAPAVQKSPAMDHKTHTFQYEIKENKLIAKPQIVSGLMTESIQRWMYNDEIVSALKLSWNEAEGGTRRIVFDLIKWNNRENGTNGIEMILPDGKKKILNLPGRSGKKQEPFKLDAVFAVKPGKNILTIRIVSLAKHYKFQFDRIALYKTNAPIDKLPPLLKLSFSEKDGIYHPGAKVVLNARGYNLPNGNGRLTYKVTDAFGTKVTEGSTVVKNGSGQIELSAAKYGYFKVSCKSGPTVCETAYVVIEPVAAENIPDSRFGCHAIPADGYRLRYCKEVAETDTRRAFLAGARWVRHHSIHWFLREPEKGKFDWTYFDERLALAEKYKMNFLLTFTGTPKWASSSANTKMTCCGTYYYQNYPPKNWQDWTDFVTVTVSRYKGRIKWYEFGNEAGYKSAFWTNGSPSDFGMLLKTGYEAAKKADPDCVILSGAPLPPPNFLEEAVKSVGGRVYFDIMSFHYGGNDKRDNGLVSQWRTALAQMGVPNMPLVNTEEMTWRKKNRTDLESASLLQKVYVREAALGVRKTFAFDFFRSGSSFMASAFDIDGRVLPLYAAYRTMTHRLEHAKFIANLSTPETEAYLFDRRGTPVIVIWSKKQPQVELPLGVKQAMRVDLMDAVSPVKTVNGTLRLKISDIPLSIEGGDMKLLTAYGRILEAIPDHSVIKPGSTGEFRLNLDKSVTGLQLKLPSKWTGSITRDKLKLSVPKDALEGVYDMDISAIADGHKFAIHVVVDVSRGNPGENLIKNGDFARGGAHWFYPKDKNKFDVVKGGGIEEGNAIRTKGMVFFGTAGGIKVRPGEKYLFIVEAKGDGLLGGVYSLTDKNNKKVFPQRPGINCLVSKLGKNWKTFSQEIRILQPEAAKLKFAMIANYGDKTGKEVLFNRFAIIRLTDRFPRNKALYQGVYVKTAGEPKNWNNIPAMKADRESEVIKKGSGVKWSGEDDLSASCRMAMDNKFVYLDFKVKDDVNCLPAPGHENVWDNDSIQVAFDPKLDGLDRTEIAFSIDKSGKPIAYKIANFWTPELPENITPYGLLKDVAITAKSIPGGMNYKIKIPLNELYPLTAKTKEFGFSWLVNDNDGKGRKYIQWSSGIGGDKKASLFGIVRCKK